MHIGKEDKEEKEEERKEKLPFFTLKTPYRFVGIHGSIYVIGF